MHQSILGILAIGLLGSIAFGCSSDDNSGGGSKADYAAQCERICSKSGTCQMDFDCALCDSIPDGALNCNFGKVKAKVDECTKGKCDDFAACTNEIIQDVGPQLSDGDGPSGSGGSGSGSGGRAGSGGRSSGGSSSGSGGSGGGSTADFAAQCDRLCTKDETCNLGFNCAACSQVPAGVLECDLDALTSKIDECVEGACSDLVDCVGALPEICPALGEPSGTGGTSGSGGTPGTGGRTGTGGTSAGAGCSACAKAEACCIGIAEYAGQDPADCDGLVSACEGVPAAQQSLIAEQCVSIINSGASLPVPACK